MRDKTDSNTRHVVIIVNSIPPYAYEANNILALPNGFAYRFRFRRKWMPTVENPMGLRGRSGLVVLRNFNTAEFVPLRRIRVSNILEVGEVYYIEYVLEDIMDFDSHGKDRDEQLKKFNELMNVAIRGFKNIPGQDLEQLIFMSPDLAYGIKDNHFEGVEENRPFNSWGNLIQILGQIDCYIDLDFFKVVEIADSRGQAAPIVIHPYPNTARFHLKNNAVYRVRVFQRTFTHRRGEGDSSVLKRRQIALRGEPGEVRTIRSIHTVAGKYDLYRFPFKTEPPSRTRDVSLSLEIQREDAKAPPNIDIPLRISVGRTQKLVWATSLACFAIGIALLFGADQIGQLTSLQADLLERIGILMAIISSYGVAPFAKSMLERIGVEYQL